MAEWIVVLTGPDGKIVHETIMADLADWDDDSKTLDFTDVRALADIVDQLIVLSEHPPENKERVKAELTQLLQSAGATTCASFDRSRVVGYFRGKRAVGPAGDPE